MLSQAVAAFFCIPIWRMEIVFCVFAAAAANVCTVFVLDRPRRAVPWGATAFFLFYYWFLLYFYSPCYLHCYSQQSASSVAFPVPIYIHTYVPRIYTYIRTYINVYYIYVCNTWQEYNGRTSQRIRICICLLVYCAEPGTAATNFAGKFCIWVPLKQRIQF